MLDMMLAGASINNEQEARAAACYQSPERIVSRLLDRHLDGDPNYPDLLSIAIDGNNRGALKSLWEHGANPNDRGGDGVSTGLDAAIGCGRASAILDMLRHGAKWTPYRVKQLVWFLQNYSGAGIITDDLVAELNKRGYKKLPESVGKNALFDAYDSNAAAILIGLGADVNARDNNGNTPLIRTVLERNIGVGGHDMRMLKVLLDNGADANARDAARGSAVDVAVDLADHDALALLKTHGGKRLRHVSSYRRDLTAPNNLERAQQKYWPDRPRGIH
jgi:ankyrin repeat protein